MVVPTSPLPEIVIVFSTPVPLATTPSPTKLRVVARVDNATPSSSTVIPLIPLPLPPESLTAVAKSSIIT